MEPPDPSRKYEAPVRRPRREMEACDDPICCCEAEPRWLRFEREQELSEWEVLDRPPREEF